VWPAISLVTVAYFTHIEPVRSAVAVDANKRVVVVVVVVVVWIQIIKSY